MKRKIKKGFYVPTDREREMYDVWKSGLTLQEVGNIYGISRERVRQILRVTFGLTAKDNAIRQNRVLLNMWLAKKDQHEASKKYKEFRYHCVFGCHEELVSKINGKPFDYTRDNRYRCKAGDYVTQRHSASRREIGWKLSFPEWWHIWETSGKYNLRGRGKGYCMARYGDTGDYEIENVYICTIGQNFSDMYLVRTINHNKSHCLRGHERIAENLYKTGNCKLCHRIYEKKRYWHNKELQQATA